MAFRDLVPFLGRKDNPVANLIVLGLGYSNQPIPPKRSLQLQSLEGYQLNSHVYTCVNLLARGCAGIPWVLYKKTGTGKPQKIMSLRTAVKGWRGDELSKKAVRNSEILDHPILTLLERPNPLMGGSAYTEWVIASLMINGNSYETWVGPDTGPNRGKPIELWPLRADRMIVVVAPASSGQLIGGYQYRVGTSLETFPSEMILHQKFFSPLDDLYGLSPIQVASRTIDGDNNAALWNAKLLENDARPPAALIVKHGLQKDTREAMRRELEERFAGAKNARRPMVLEGDVDWKLLSVNPADLDWINGRKLNAREIANIFGVPAEFVDMDSVSYASKEQARKGLYMETIMPLMDRRRDYLNNSGIVRAFGDGLHADYDRDQIEALHEDAQNQYKGLRQADWLSLNEKRNATGYDDYTDDPASSKPADVPVALLAPGKLPGSPEDTGTPGNTTEPAAHVPPSAEGGSKGQQLSDHQKALEHELKAKLDGHFREQAKALGRHLRQKLG